MIRRRLLDGALTCIEIFGIVILCITFDSARREKSDFFFGLSSAPVNMISIPFAEPLDRQIGYASADPLAFLRRKVTADECSLSDKLLKSWWKNWLQI